MQDNKYKAFCDDNVAPVNPDSRVIYSREQRVDNLYDTVNNILSRRWIHLNETPTWVEAKKLIDDFRRVVTCQVTDDDAAKVLDRIIVAKGLVDQSIT